MRKVLNIPQIVSTECCRHSSTTQWRQMAAPRFHHISLHSTTLDVEVSRVLAHSDLIVNFMN